MRALDCCAGAGGFSLGLQRAGFSVHGVELDATACETHRAQVGPCDNADLWEYAPREQYDLVAGGIPCQSHSLAGKRGGTSDPRGQLYVPFLRIAQDAGARAVLIENVRGLLTSRSADHGTALRELEFEIRRAGFTYVAHRVLNAADYGVPQERERLFIVAFYKPADLAAFSWPRSSHAWGGSLLGARHWVTIREALSLGDGRYAHGLLPGASWKSPLGMRMLDVDRPSPTVRASNGADLLCLEGGKPERLTDKQLALLQSFPAGMAFAGNKTARVRQIGNAVPPPLAEAVGRSVFAALARVQREVA